MRSNNYARSSLLLVVVVVFIFFLSNEAQGIRFGNGMIKPLGHLEKTLEEESRLIVEGFRKITLCENGHCNSGNNRKLLTATSPIPSSPTPSTRNNEGNKKGNPMSSSHKEDPSVKRKDNLENSEAVSKNLEANLDLIDIAEMDYSPAKRKPPIHN
ncbi:uncharacterized protein LOC120069249 [Benincasa hispida]|uniref:uncharacterized protein LOC120069249 n=1 Tax=Benincasa hispida TaxID=102211 RepID=UPI001901FCAE|nr:uncharacterized protein LOC120069249 [Benincasa hispida]